MPSGGGPPESRSSRGEQRLGEGRVPQVVERRAAVPVVGARRGRGLGGLASSAALVGGGAGGERAARGRVRRRRAGAGASGSRDHRAASCRWWPLRVRCGRGRRPPRSGPRAQPTDDQGQGDQRGDEQRPAAGRRPRSRRRRGRAGPTPRRAITGSSAASRAAQDPQLPPAVVGDVARRRRRAPHRRRAAPRRPVRRSRCTVVGEARAVATASGAHDRAHPGGVGQEQHDALEHGVAAEADDHDRQERRDGARQRGDGVPGAEAGHRPEATAATVGPAGVRRGGPRRGRRGTARRRPGQQPPAEQDQQQAQGHRDPRQVPLDLRRRRAPPPARTRGRPPRSRASSRR